MNLNRIADSGILLDLTSGKLKLIPISHQHGDGIGAPSGFNDLITGHFALP